ncbi:LamG-like jellyroll fold domain-containing protein [Pseudarthrobacter sp. H2]|uniref:LamG-like jellyroll fold domain-containing protein n=1 Tax=Pseudarthrobacter sp. H2 TaxID=3418415 RepID=UPI003CF8F2A2
MRKTAKKLTALLLAAAVALSLGLVGGLPAAADTAPADPGNPATPVTVSADGLPTAQINGVAWTQVIIGTTVYVGGKFTEARPFGAAPGTGGVVRNNILAYNLTTGELLNTFTPSFNAEVTALAASPDGSRLYVGGSFTTYNGATVWRAVALNPANGALIPGFLPRMSSSVRAIVATPTTVYLGGVFNAVGTVSRGGLAAVSASNAALLPWNPVAAGGRVNALVLSPDGGSMVAGGAFTTMNGSSNPGFGLAKVDTAMGALLPFKINNTVRNGGTDGAITTLATDGTNIFGAGYSFRGTAPKVISNWEGMFSVKWSDDSTTWLEDCHGDSYSIQPMGDVVYLAGHAHYCGNLGGFPQTEPRQFNRGIAFSKQATGTLTTDSHGYPNFAGTPSPSLLNWFPIVDAGTFTGQGQGPWTLAGNADYVAMAGEFTIINNQPQQGLTRFAKSSIAPDVRGPRITGLNSNPSLSTPAAGAVRVRWQANWDQDNENLTYEVRRNGAVISTVNQASTFWRRPGMTFTDTGLVPGRSYGYRIFARDAFGNEARSDTVSVTVAGSVAAPGTYAQQVLADQPGNYWRLGETAGATGVDLAGKDDLIVRPGVSFGAAGALGGDADTAAAFNGTADGVASSPTLAGRSNTFSAEAWIRTSSTRGGEVISYGNTQTGVSTDSDRKVYMDSPGRIFFGVRPTGTSSGGARITVNTTASYNDDQWHHIVATLGAGGMQLFVDGTLGANRTGTTTAWPFDGFWRIGGDNLNGWPSVPASRYLAGLIDDVAIYPSALPLSRAQAHYAASGRAVTAPPANVPPVAAFTSSATNLAVAFDASGSSDSDGTITGYAWNFGDGTSGTGATASHAYAGAGSYPVTLTVTDNNGATGTVNRAVAVTAPPANAVLAADAFGRSLTGGFGTADTGGAWTVSGGNSNFAVNNGTGAMTLGVGGASRTAYLTSLSAAPFDGSVKVSADKIANGGGMYVSLVGRRADNNDYRAKVKIASDGVVSLYLTKVINDVQTTLAGPFTIPGLSMAVNDPLVIRLKLDGTGPTNLSGKVWRASGTEPAAWHLTASDSTAVLQTAGSPGLIGYLSGSATNVPVILRFDDFSVKIP